MAVLVMVSLYGISMGIRSQGAALQSSRAGFLEQCEAFGLMAVQEAVRFLRVRANQEGTPVFEAFHAEAASADLPLAPADLTYLAAELARYPAYSLRSLEAEILRRGAMAAHPEEAVVFDGVGLVRITATVTGPTGASATQVAEYGFRTCLAAAPRPFDLFTFYLGDATAVLAPEARDNDPNVTMKFAVERLGNHKKKLAELAQGFDDLAVKVQEELDRASGLPIGGPSDGDKAKAQVAITALRAMATAYRAAGTPPQWPAEVDWQLGPPGDATQDLPGRLHEFAFPLTVYSIDDTVDLAKFNVPARIKGPLGGLTERDPLIEAAFTALREAMEKGADAPEAVEPVGLAFLELVKPDAAQAHELLGVYKEFQDLLVEVSGGAREDLQRRARRLDPGHQDLRAHFRFVGPGAAARAREFLAGRPAPRGLVWVDDPSEPLEVSISGLAGRLVVASRTRMRVEQANVVDPAKDALVLLGLGGVEVSQGGIQAQVLSRNGRYQGSGESFTGSLVVDTLDPSSLGLQLTGTIKRQPALISAPIAYPERPPPEPATVHVTLGPEAIYRRLDR